MPSTNIFSLEGQGLKLDTAADVEPHIRSLRDDDAVEEIRLAGNTLGVGACEELGKVLETKKTLKIANLADIFTSRLLDEIPPSLSSLLTALLTLPHLHTVNLSDNAFGLNTQAPLVAFLSSHVPLQHLILNNNGLGPRAGVLVADALTALHAKKDAARKESTAGEVPDLETIICGRNRLESGSMEAWAKVFSAHRGVKEVKMVQNGIRQEGIAALLTKGLAHATSLRVLDLQDNTFTRIGSRALAQVLPGWTQLRELGVGDCLLSARGGVAVAEAFGGGSNHALRVLRLQYNGLDSTAIKALADTLGKDALPSLRRVELNGNRFEEDDDQVERIRDILSERKDAAAQSSTKSTSDPNSDNTVDDDDDEEWGIDSLSDLEEESDEEEEEEEEEEDEDEAADSKAADKDESDDEKDLKAERVLKEADQAEAENVAEEKDEGVDRLAEKLARTGL
ncbi:MAG: hypothetical protein M1817_000717 [Caeruleum heppii]|nr:MAG: hypothetical protein M1817_000717 [Caeruleum heppii]